MLSFFSKVCKMFDENVQYSTVYNICVAGVKTGLVFVEMRSRPHSSEVTFPLCNARTIQVHTPETPRIRLFLKVDH
jgi:hypothetical protein